MFVNRSYKTTLVKIFEEAIKVEKDFMSYEPDRSGKANTFPRRMIERPNSEKDKAFDIEQLHNAIWALTNEVVGLKKTILKLPPLEDI